MAAQTTLRKCEGRLICFEKIVKISIAVDVNETINQINLPISLHSFESYIDLTSILSTRIFPVFNVHDNNFFFFLLYEKL